MEKLKNSGYSGVSRWYKKVSEGAIFSIVLEFFLHFQVHLLEQDLLVAFINHGGTHWTLLINTMYILL